MKNTITIYPKTALRSAPTYLDDKPDSEDLEHGLVDYEHDFDRFLSNQEIYSMIGDPYLDITRFIRWDDPEHDLYHQDDLSRKQLHYHMELRDPINNDTFEKILQLLFIDDLITECEKTRLSIAYTEANLLRDASAESEEIAIAENTPAKKEATASPQGHVTRTSSFSAGFFKLASALHAGMANIPYQPFMPPFR